MSIQTPITRRSALAAGAVGAGAVAVAACGGGTTPTSKPTSTPDAKLVALDSITVGEAVAASLPNGAKVVVARPTASTAVCFSAICTHAGCTVQPQGKTLNCPCHGSVYNALTGAVISGPAPNPLPVVSVHVVEGDVVTGA